MGQRKQDINQGAMMMILVIGGLAGLLTWSLPVAVVTIVALGLIGGLSGIIR